MRLVLVLPTNGANTSALRWTPTAPHSKGKPTRSVGPSTTAPMGMAVCSPTATFRVKPWSNVSVPSSNALKEVVPSGRVKAVGAKTTRIGRDDLLQRVRARHAHVRPRLHAECRRRAADRHPHRGCGAGTDAAGRLSLRMGRGRSPPQRARVRPVRGQHQHL